MLTINIPPRRLWDEINEVFINFKGATLDLEHSLVSLTTWESKWCKPFLSSQEKTAEETIDYIRCMTLTQNVDPDVYKFLTDENFKTISDYIDAPMTATRISDKGNSKRNREIVTSELIYCWMFAFNIPMEFEKCHLNRLIMQIQVCEIKSQPPKKRSKKETAMDYAALNAERRKKLNSKG